MIKNLAFLLIILLLVLCQTAVMAPLFNDLNCYLLVIALTIFVMALPSPRLLIWTAILGLVAESFSAYPAGVITFALLITAVTGNLLFRNYFSHRLSLSSILLVIILSVVYRFSVYLLDWLWAIVLNKNSTDVLTLSNSLLNPIITTVVFSLISIISFPIFKNIRERFLVR